MKQNDEGIEEILIRINDNSTYVHFFNQVLSVHLQRVTNPVSCMSVVS